MTWNVTLQDYGVTQTLCQSTDGLGYNSIQSFVPYKQYVVLFF